MLLSKQAHDIAHYPCVFVSLCNPVSTAEMEISGLVDLHGSGKTVLYSTVLCTLLYCVALIIFDCSHCRFPKYFGDVHTTVHTAAVHSRLRLLTTVTSLSHVNSLPSLAAAVSVCEDQQFGTNFHMICEAQTLGNSSNVGLRTGYLSVRTAGKTRLINELTCLLT